MDGARLSTGGNAQVTSALAPISGGGVYGMHLHNGILHLVVAGSPAVHQMSEARDQIGKNPRQRNCLESRREIRAFVLSVVAGVSTSHLL